MNPGNFDTIKHSLRLLPLFVAAALALACSGLGSGGDRSLRFASTVAGANGEFGETYGVAVKNGDIYVSDGQNGTISVIHDGKLSVFLSGLDTPSGLAFLPDGRLVVADPGTSQISISENASDPGSRVSYGSRNNARGFADGDADAALFNGPIGVATASDGRIFVADTYNDRIRVIENGRVSTLAGGLRGFADGAGDTARFDTPTGLAVWQDKLLVADTGNNRVRVVEPNGVVWTLAGKGENDSKDGIASYASLARPAGIAVDASGTVYVGTTLGVKTITGIFPIVRSTSVSSRGASDGALPRARFNSATGLAIDSDGSVIVADGENRLVRRLSVERGPEISGEQIAALRGTAEQFRNAAPGRWPFDPATRPREIAGTLGEIRGEMKPGNEDVWFHNGLDIAGGYGEVARFVRDEKVLRPIAVDNFNNLRESLRMPTIGYIHIRLGRDKDGKPFDDARFQFGRDASGKVVDVRIPRGSAFKAGEPIGTLNAMNHVHLIAGRSGSEMNALDALLLPGVSDTRPPTVETLRFWSAGTELRSTDGHIALKGPVTISMKAFDQVDGNVARRRLGLYQAGWQLLHGDKSPVTDVQWNIRFDRMPPGGAVRFAYADGSKSGATGETIFDYLVTNRVEGDEYGDGLLDTTAFAPGNYIVRVWAGDYFGNNSYVDTPVEIVR